MVLKQSKINMASNIQKRKHNEIDSDEEKGKCYSWPRFIVLENINGNDKAITKISPFVIEKTLKGIIGEAKSVKKLRDNRLLVECKNEQQSKTLRNKHTFGDITVLGSSFGTLNRSKGVFRDRERDLRDLPLLEVTKELKNQNPEIIWVDRIHIKKNGERIPTNTYVTTFDMPTPPQKIKIGYYSVKIELYIPNPIRCFKCQRFGHTKENCRKDEVCFRCGTTHHEYGICTATPKCVNCEGDHPSASKGCPIWKKEKEIQKIKTENRISYPEARAKYNSINPTISYATIVKKVTRDVSCQTEIESKPPKVATRPPVPQKPQFAKNNKNTETSDKTSIEKDKKVESQTSEDSLKEKHKIQKKTKIESDRLPKGSKDPLSVYNRYDLLGEEEMEASSTRPRTHSLSPSRRGKIKLSSH